MEVERRFVCIALHLELGRAGKLPVTSSRRQAMSPGIYRSADRIVKPIETQVPQQAAWDCCETEYAERIEDA